MQFADFVLCTNKSRTLLSRRVHSILLLVQKTCALELLYCSCLIINLEALWPLVFCREIFYKILIVMVEQYQLNSRN